MGNLDLKLGPIIFSQTFFLLFIICCAVVKAEEEKLSSCRSDLGMGSGVIPDDAISASSAYDKKSVGPHNSRIRTEKNGGAWCPKQQIGKHTYEWLQIDLGELHVLSMVETQGRFGNGQGQEFAPNYYLEYQREIESEKWLRFRDLKGVELMEGNMNTFLAELRELHPPIIARRIRFIPYASHPRTVCMRVELYGCPWKDGTISYSMRQGDRRSPDMDFHDFTYDGSVVDGQLSGGLGQLTDLEEGDPNFRLDLKEIGKKGYEWLAWKNDGPYGEPLEIIFQFDSVRNFSSVVITCNSVPNKEVGVFREARVEFSVGGVRYGGEEVVYREGEIKGDRRVVIPLGYRVGRFVKISFYFDMRWLMISEVRFVGGLFINSHNTEIGEIISNLCEATNTRITIERVSQYIPVELPLAADSSYVDVSAENRQRKKHIITPNISLTDPQSVTAKITVDSSMAALSTEETLTSSRVKLSDTYIGIIIGTLCAFILLMIVIGLFILFRNHKRKSPNGNSKLKSTLQADIVHLSLGDDPTLLMTYSRKLNGNGNIHHTLTSLDGAMTSDVAMYEMSRSRLIPNNESFDSEQTFQLRAADKINNSVTDDNTAMLLLPSTAHPGSMSLSHSDKAFHHPIQSQTINPHRGAVHPMYPEARDAPPPRPLHGTLARRRTASPNHEPIRPPNPPPATVKSAEKLPSNLQHLLLQETDLKHIMKLGDGAFGEVSLCELRASNEDEILTEKICKSKRETSFTGPVLVVVKLLQKSASHIRLDFYREIDMMLSLKDPNIAQVVGICRVRDRPSVVVEYLRGNLHQYLQRASYADDPSNSPSHGPRLSYGCLIYMANQIASGMKMLESLDLVHKDLAARSCLIGPRFLVKISDFGVNSTLYPADYYKIEGLQPLPIRWMAWESVILNKFTNKTDVWSFAVTLWEILTLARTQPFSTLSNEQILEVCSFRYRDLSEHETFLCQPDNCPKEIYDLMVECWHQDEARRPSFREIHMFLQRKNMGYSPDDEQLCGAVMDSRSTCIT